jgi:NADH:ubiquinone oxidoreductase subunit 4 (subunit M)
MSDHASSVSEVFAMAATQPKITGMISALVTSIGLSNINSFLGVIATILGIIVAVYTLITLHQRQAINKLDRRIKEFELKKLEKEQ